MLASNDTIKRWIIYGLAALLCFLFQSWVCQNIVIWGVIPFLYPLLAAIPATYEKPLDGVVFALVLGVICDLLLPGSIPCFHCWIFPLVAFCSAALSESLFQPGILCSIAASTLAFVLTDGAHCLILWAQGKATWEASMFLSFREFCATIPLVIPMTFLFHAVHEKTRQED